MYAITKAAEWLALNAVIIESKQVVILTDSMSALETMNHWPNTNHQTLVNQMIGITNILEDMDFSLTLQFVPSHVGIEGNEMADQLARDGHRLTLTTPCPLNKNDVKRKVKIAQKAAFQLEYDTIKEERPLHIAEIKPKVGLWPWTSTKHRASDTAAARLRIGHSELNEPQHRFRMSDTPLCDRCQTPETTEHYLIYCRKYIWSRRKMTTNLTKEGINNITVQTLLGGGEYSMEQQRVITLELGKFLRDSGRMTGMAPT